MEGSWQKGLWLILFAVLNISSTVADKGEFAVKRVDQCYGKPIPVSCEPGYMVRVVHAYYRQSRTCSSSFHSDLCLREEPNNPACVGNRTCVFTTPWVYLSPDCGYSNSFLIIYQCVPALLLKDICFTKTLEAPSGFLVTPNYPLKYPASLDCRTEVQVSAGKQINFYLLDIYLAYYNHNNAKQCIDQLSIVDSVSQKRTSPICIGQQRGLVFTSSSSQAVVYFSSTDHSFTNAKGFWLYYEAVDLVDPDNGTLTSSVPLLSNTTITEHNPKQSTTSLTEPTTETLTPSTITPTTTSTPTSESLLVDGSFVVSTLGFQIDTAPKSQEQLSNTVGKTNEQSTTITPLRDKGFVDLLFAQDSTPWYLKYATKFKSTTSTVSSLSSTVHSATKSTQGTKFADLPSTKLIRPSSRLPISYIFYYTTTAPHFSTSSKHPKPSTTKTTMKIPGPKVTRLPEMATRSISHSWPKVPMVIDADHPSLISDILIDRPHSRGSVRPTPISHPATKPPDEVSPAPHSQPSNLHSAAQGNLILGLTVPEIGAIAGGGACFVGLTIAIIVTIAMHKRLRRKHVAHHKNVKAKKPFTDVIMAYESNDSSSTNGISNMAFNGARSDPENEEYPTSREGKVNGTWKSWNTGLVPIDETIEDLYTEVKRCDLDPERARNKAKFIKGRSRSKSLDDLLVRTRHARKRGGELLPMSLSLDSLDCSVHSHSNLTNVTGSCFGDGDSDLDPEFYERLDEMYSDVALAHVRARAQHYEELQQQLETLSMPVTPLSGSPYVRMHRSPALSHASPIDTPFEMSLLDHEDLDIAL